MQENYRTDHGSYAGTFSDLGIPQGARLQDGALIWDGAYQISFTRLIRDQRGTVVHYTIEATPTKADPQLPIIEIDDAGKLTK